MLSNTTFFSVLLFLFTFHVFYYYLVKNIVPILIFLFNVSPLYITSFLYLLLSLMLLFAVFFNIYFFFFSFFCQAENAGRVLVAPNRLLARLVDRYRWSVEPMKLLKATLQHLGLEASLRSRDTAALLALLEAEFFRDPTAIAPLPPVAPVPAPPPLLPPPPPQVREDVAVPPTAAVVVGMSMMFDPEAAREAAAMDLAQHTNSSIT